MNKKTLLRYSVVFGAVYFFSSNGLGSLPNLSLNFLLKEKIGLTPTQLAYFQAITYLAWVIKPIWGYMSDVLPIFGSRRKSYLMISSACAGLVWICLSMVQNYTVSNLLILITISYFAYAFQDVVADGFMVEVGKPFNLTGRFQSIQWGAVYLAMTITAVCGGAISDLARKGTISYQATFGITALFPLLTFFLAGFWAKEPAGNPTHNVSLEIRTVLKNRELWILSAFLFFWNFSPSINAPFFYYAVDTLKFDGAFLGWTQAVGGIAGLLGSLCYRHVERIPVRKFLVFAVYLGSGAMLFMFVYFLPYVVAHLEIARAIALVSNFVLGMANTLIFLTLVNLAAKMCPQYAGGTTFALLMSFYNLGSMGSSAVGGFLLSIVGLKVLIAISALFSLVTLFFIPHLSLEKDRARLA